MSLEAEYLWDAVKPFAGPYPPQAFQFVQDGLRHTVETLFGEHDGYEDEIDDFSRHVSGQQLCIGLRDHAVRQYGLLALPVLNAWNIRRTEDFGNIVFALVDAGLMRKNEEDHLSDFAGVYEFDEVFSAPMASAS
ncbi:MAG: hypothetical protein RLN60_04970 [Phycisphaerales bacterium]